MGNAVQNWLLNDSISDGMIIVQKTDYLDIYDYSKKKNIQVKKYTNKKANLSFEGDYGLLETTGEDSKTYFNLITRDGSICFEPICGEEPVFSKDCIIYKNNGKYYVCNQKGENLASDMLYKRCNDAKNGIFQMSSENGVSYIDKTGNTIFNVVNTK